MQDPASMLGAITGRDVLRNSATIVREFGPGAYARCVLALVAGRPRTFLAAVTGPPRSHPRRHRSVALVVGLALAVSLAAAGAAGVLERPARSARTLSCGRACALVAAPPCGSSAAT